jgi:hypothetical protein
MRSLFVSHSSKDRVLTQSVCDAIGAAAPSRTVEPVVDYDVLVDYDRLVAGRVWPRQLHEWMACCHSGLLLLTANAIESDWVLKEATILSWRCSLDETFRLFIARSPDVTDAQLDKHGYSPLRLDDVQWLGTMEPAAIAAQVHAAFPADDPPETLFDRTAATLADLLANVREETLRRVAEKVSAQAPAWNPNADRARQYVDQIARRLLSESLGAFDGVRDFIDTLSQTAPKETVADMLRHVAPYWVDATAAGRLPRLSRLRPAGAAAINGNHVVKYSARMYVSRAHPLTLSWEYIGVPNAGAGDFVEYVKREICKEVRRLDNSEETDEVVIEQLKGWRCVYIGLPEVPPPDDLVELRGLFPNATFILDAGPALNPVADLENVVWLEPELDTAVETQQYTSFSEAERIIRRRR